MAAEVMQLAHAKTARARKHGLLVAPELCEWCGLKKPLVAHHSDYSRPLVIDWWCRACHTHHHSAERRGLRATQRAENKRLYLGQTA